MFHKMSLLGFVSETFFLSSEGTLKQNEGSATCNDRFAHCLAKKTGVNMNGWTAREVGSRAVNPAHVDNLTVTTRCQNLPKMES